MTSRMAVVDVAEGFVASDYELNAFGFGCSGRLLVGGTGER